MTWPHVKRLQVRGTATYKYRTYSDPDGPNYHLIQHLNQEMQREEALGANVHKMRAFSTAIKAIHELDYPLKKLEQVQKINGVGPGITRRIMEFMGVSRKRDYGAVSAGEVKELGQIRAMQELQRVNGIGPIKARALVESGCTSLNQLHEDRFLKTLSKLIQTSLIYERDIRAQVTRQQAEAFMASLREVIPTEFESHLVGSYRRGHPTSSDIDILLLHPSYTTLPRIYSSSISGTKNGRIQARPPPTLLHDSVIEPLTQKGNIVSALSGGTSRWQGLVKIQVENEEMLRRVDIFLMPQPSEAAALLALTGDALFNLDCRKHAKERGMHLNEFGLWRQRVQDVPLVDSVDDAVLGSSEGGGQDSAADSAGDRAKAEFVQTSDEVTLLEELGMEYIAPERRNLANLNMSRRKEARRAQKEKLSSHSRKSASSGKSQYCPSRDPAPRPAGRTHSVREVDLAI